MKNLKQIKILPAREKVASTLKSAIFKGDLKPGQEITLEEIAGKVGVSIMPVREAFQMLANDGFLELRHNKAATVLGINEKTITDHFKTRALLEGECCALASAKGVDISEIEKVLSKAKKMVDKEKYSDYYKLNYDFHLAIWEAGDNSKTTAILKTMWNGLSIRHRVTEEEYAKNSVADHEELFRLIKANEGELARQAMHTHLLKSLDSILHNFTSGNVEYLKLLSEEFVSID